ncbi:MAG: hypothetical protein K0Q81_1741 [Paenibacillus sp.]|nr:hypothetical protein [Paenibacillus sp.]
MEDNRGFAVGLFNGIVLALPLWGIILSLVTLIMHH